MPGTSRELPGVLSLIGTEDDTEYLYHDTKQRVVRHYRYKHLGIVTADAKSRALPGSTLWLEL